MKTILPSLVSRGMIACGFLALLAGAMPGAERQATARREPDVIYVPTPQEVVEAMLRMANVKPGDVVYDLGCGDGRVVITAAKKFGATGVGVDINPDRIEEANANARAANVTDRVKFMEGDMFQTDLRKATVVTLYLLTSLNLKLKPKLFAELKPGSRIVSHAFDMGEWKPEREETVNRRRIFLWTIPDKPASGN